MRISTKEILFSILIGAFVITVLLVQDSFNQSLNPNNPLPVPNDRTRWDKCLGPGLSWRDSRWVVYPDRDNVPVYEDENCTIRKNMTLSFIDKACRGKIKGYSVLKTSKSPDAFYLAKAKTENPYMTESYENDYIVGWVKAEHLIISYEPARHNKSMIPKKAFIVNPWEYFQEYESPEEFQERKAKARTGPGENYPVTRVVSGMDLFYYVYKYDIHNQDNINNAQWVLIGSKKGIIGDPSDCIIGWVERKRIAEWDTREALEPNPEINTTVYVYKQEADLLHDENRILEIPLNETVWPPEKWRWILMYPGYDSCRVGKNYIHYARIGYMGRTLFCWEGDTVGFQQEDIFANRNDLYNGLSHINIIFVMDATRSMRNYLKLTAETINSVMCSISQDFYSKNEYINIRFGATVYRDHKDVSDPNTPSYNETAILTSNYQSVKQFLYDQFEPTFKNTNGNYEDQDYYEALFYGVRKAVRSFLIQGEGETNIFIIIGDAGNNDSEDSRNKYNNLLDDIKNFCKGNPPYIYALHLNRRGSGKDERQAIKEFPNDINNIFSQIEGPPEIFRKVYLTAKNINEYPDPALKTLAATEIITNDSMEEIIRKAGKPLEDIIRQVINRNLHIVTNFESYMEYVSDPNWIPSPGSYDAKALSVLLNAMYQVAGDDTTKLKTYLTPGTQIYQVGYIKRRNENNVELMRPVIFLEENELETTNRIYKNFRETAKDFYGAADIWRELTGVITGDETNNPAEYINMRAGICTRNMSSFLKLSWDDLQDLFTNSKKTEERYVFLKSTDDAIEKLNSYRIEEEKWMEHGNYKFIWLPAEDLP